MSDLDKTAERALFRERLKRIAVLIVVAWSVWQVESHIVVNTSESTNARVFWRIDGKPKKGDYVTLIFTHPFVGNDILRITKQIRCVSGERLVRSGADFYCNSEWLVHAREKSRANQTLPQFAWSGPVPQGKAFLAGNHNDSFDSRYWGFAETAKLERLLVIY